MFDRYAIVSSADQRAFVEMLEHACTAEKEKAEHAGKASAETLERAQVSGGKGDSLNCVIYSFRRAETDS